MSDFTQNIAQIVKIDVISINSQVGITPLKRDTQMF